MNRFLKLCVGVFLGLVVTACEGPESAPVIPPAHTVDYLGEPESWSEDGLRIAMDTQQLLGKNLMSRIQSDGTVAALAFCNEQAIELTHQKSRDHKADIRRVSDRPRNPANAAQEDERRYIEQFKAAVAAGGAIKPITTRQEGEHRFYFPIITNQMCLQCHGLADNLQPAVRTALGERYPDDQATGYDVNQVRGMWSIGMATP